MMITVSAEMLVCLSLGIGQPRLADRLTTLKTIWACQAKHLPQFVVFPKPEYHSYANCLHVGFAEIPQFATHPGYGSFLELYSNASSAADTVNWSGDLSGTYQAAQGLCLDVRASTFRNNTVSVASQGLCEI